MKVSDLKPEVAKTYIHARRRAWERLRVHLGVVDYVRAQVAIDAGRGLHFHTKAEGECYVVLDARTGVYWGAVVSKATGAIVTVIPVPREALDRVRGLW